MHDQKIAKHDVEKGSIGSAAAAVAGAVVGAGIAVAGVVLADGKNREKIINTVATAKKGVVEYIEKSKAKMEVEKEVLAERLGDDKSKITKLVASAKDSLHQTVQEVNEVVKSL